MEMQGEGARGCHIFRTCLIPRMELANLASLFTVGQVAEIKYVERKTTQIFVRGLHKRRLQRFLASPLFSFSPCLYHLTPVVDSWSPPRSRCGRHMCMAPSGVISGLHLSFHTWGKDEGGAPRSIVLSKREKRNFRIPMSGGENERGRK